MVTHLEVVMKNLRILSMDLGKKYIPIKDRNKKRFVTEFIDHEKYDVVMLQGNRISSNIDLNYLEDTHYSICSSSDKVVTLFNWNSIFSGTVVSSCYNAIISKNGITDKCIIVLTYTFYLSDGNLNLSTIEIDYSNSKGRFLLDLKENDEFIIGGIKIS